MKKTEFLTIFPTFENLETVKITLPSVLDETLKNDARLIVHDSSVNGRDEKWDYLLSLNRNNDFFLILSSNMSMAHARNMCLHLGQELYAPDYLCIMDDDHGFKPGLISAMAEAMKKYYGKISPNGLRYGMFSACFTHTKAKLEKIDDIYSFPAPDNDPFTMGGFNSCFRCATTSHWNNVLKGYDTDEYLISLYQTSNIRWRNYHKGFTVLFVGNGHLVFDIDTKGRGTSSPDKLGLWDDKYCASDARSKYYGKGIDIS
ncbi:hypothetical protein BIY37_03880 [Candidatus Brocadia sapporoensis]|uniref:Glycosyltransferase 2-like domain-containing protein n=1 Tax=Candidatus Brocadia sapporoensis TaxID=392547 RepID=A0A1V6M1N4_9BACT|nr:glycosyltransferase family A protein [Candidatus Brocadia sapporoensis]MDG5996474.1 glycosyltransferase [Candidatus Brocadia sp.]MDG6006621.1 glycosyltransferase [Candidatus Brocadia sp.]OQD46321.1 hypothetical protein BIY37_03880 [Candidatus Brocadia sapporoensis]GJQ24526.1 MAG: hypothetical protein HBSAPP01_23160 [Candidatus Brocadia sapporoensis]